MYVCQYAFAGDGEHVQVYVHMCASVLTVPAPAHHTLGSLDHVIQFGFNELVGLPQNVHQLTGLLAVATGEECVRSALAAGTSCAANAMDIVLCLGGEVVVDHIANVPHIYKK